MTTNSAMPLNNSKVINAWCTYDIANSVYNLCISTVLWPMYYAEVTKAAFGSEMVPLWGMTIKNTVLYEVAIAAGYLFIIGLILLLSGMADLGGYRKRFMQLFTLVGASSCAALYFFTGDNILLGLILPALAIVGYAGSLVYYNSFLPLIATPDRHDKISARGFSFGYAGSIILLIFNLYSIINWQQLGFSSEMQAKRYAFVEVGVWWLLLSQYAFYYLKEKSVKLKMGAHLLTHGFIQLKSVFVFIKQHKSLSRFLLAFFFFSMGVQTVIIVATLFGSVELNISTLNLIVTVLIIQVVGILGAWFFGVVSVRFGNKTSLLWMLFIWLGVCIGGYFIQTKDQFFVIAALVGLVMGGIQSQARSTWSKLMPEGTPNTASYFSFYDSTEKLAVVMGMFSFAVIEHLSGSMRLSTLLLSVFFIISIVIVALSSYKHEE